MSTTTTRTHRSAEDWDALAREIAPELRAGVRLGDLGDRIGSNTDALRTALARQGLDPRGEELKLKEVSASRPSTLAKRIAERRQAKAPWWMIRAETGKSYGEMTGLLREYGYTTRGEMSNGNGDGNGAGPSTD